MTMTPTTQDAVLIERARYAADWLHAFPSNAGEVEGQITAKGARGLDRVVSFIRALADRIEALSQAANAEPEGWKLVPVGPTEAMLAAGKYAWHRGASDTGFREAYAAMLAASPTVEER
jgi:hypothetical protein